MKLLLTSAGLTNSSIAGSLIEMVGKPASETKIAVIPTAANLEAGNKDWFINQFTNLWQHGFSWVDIVDPSAEATPWQERLKDVDVLFVSGGNTFHLLDQMYKTGFADWLKDNIDKKVYVGVSAGTIVMSPTIDVATIEPADQNSVGLKDLTGLGYVKYDIEPHCDNERFKIMEQWAKVNNRSVYALDDMSALQVVDKKVKVVGEGEWVKY